MSEGMLGNLLDDLVERGPTNVEGEDDYYSNSRQIGCDAECS
jgi:hypothetical protein